MMTKLNCHCGAIAIETNAAPKAANECNCTFCAKRGALWAYYKPEDVQIAADAQSQSTYMFGRKVWQHHFCNVCGCSTHGEGVDWQTGAPQIIINVRLFEEADLSQIAIEQVDGRNLW